MSKEEMYNRLEVEQQIRLQESKRLVQSRTEGIIGNPNSYDDDGEFTPEAERELSKLIAQVEQYKRGYHNALEHVKQMIKGVPCPLTHSGIQRHYE